MNVIYSKFRFSRLFNVRVAALGKVAMLHTISEEATVCAVLLGETHVLRSRVGVISPKISIQDLWRDGFTIRKSWGLNSELL